MGRPPKAGQSGPSLFDVDVADSTDSAVGPLGDNGVEWPEARFSHARNQSAETGVSADGQAHPRLPSENLDPDRLRSGANDTGDGDRERSPFTFSFPAQTSADGPARSSRGPGERVHAPEGRGRRDLAEPGPSCRKGAEVPHSDSSSRAAGARPARLIVRSDGGSRGNPGPAAYGALVIDAATDEVLNREGKAIGVASNNVAEYSGLIAALEMARAINPDAAIEARLDSKLVVEQMAGHWKIKHPDMKPLAAKARGLCPAVISWTWVPRSENKAADGLVNGALDGSPVMRKQQG